MARFAETSCSQCGRSFGPGDSGFSHCIDHPPYASSVKPDDDRMPQFYDYQGNAICEACSENIPDGERDGPHQTHWFQCQECKRGFMTPTFKPDKRPGKYRGEIRKHFNRIEQWDGQKWQEPPEVGDYGDARPTKIHFDVEDALYD